MTLRLALTPGEPAGIGPDLLIQSVQSGHQHELVAYADADMLHRRARLLGLPLRLREPGNAPQPLAAGELAVVPVALATAETPGQLAPANAQYVLDCLDRRGRCLSRTRLRGNGHRAGAKIGDQRRWYRL